MKKFYSILLVMCICNAYANDAELQENISYKVEVLNTLKDEIQQIDSEMLRCKRVKKGWVAATVVGGIGVAATGTAAIVQMVRMNEKNIQQKPDEQKDGKK